ncbi:alpha-L-rhamnosidase-related protein [Clostridium felsineum]|uniref:alpha-L-rhamnosidase-related protein n=1 Tax=Clostridium felsineum TaxID=36839 RepID=UPI00098C4A56|nr:family 78 glycoside hydrolase catalytic domain [Clostridium felsineum]URZ02244.1 hypothetical protein CLAUR_022410 [Clostridium felsineum]
MEDAIVRNKKFIDIAENLKPRLKKSKVYGKNLVEVVNDKNFIHGWKVNKIGDIKDLDKKVCGKGDSFIVDFSDHEVGYLSMKIRTVGSPQDAPLRMKVILGEMPCEMKEPFSSYKGWISSSWLQEEIITIDVISEVITLPRRYSFRYLKIEVLDTSAKYKVVFDEIYCTTVTSGDRTLIKGLPENVNNHLKKMDNVSIKTLEDCMQDVFEDGPKRDRRLWLGDLRLQAISNYKTFKNYDLVKRCLYLFAGVQDNKGQVPACLFIEPKIMADDSYFWDYSLFFIDVLYDYYKETKDKNIVRDLWSTAYRQIEIVMENLGDDNILKENGDFYVFVDWNQELERQASAQAILIYCAKKALQIAEEFNYEQRNFLRLKIKELTSAALNKFWDEKEKLFIGGEKRQISWATQIWMVIAGVISKKDSKRLMKRLFERKPTIKLVTPYAYHHLIEALILSGNKEFAIDQMKAYWGKMIEAGADTFWELYDPQDEKYSPYGSNLINSYCHAWSCTPTYFIREYLI